MAKSSKHTAIGDELRFALTQRSQPALFWLSADEPTAQAAAWLDLRESFGTARFFDLDLSGVNVVSLGAELKQRLPRSFFEKPEPDTRVHIFGLENSIGNFGQTEFIAELNFERDNLFRDFPFNIIIWTDREARRQVQQHAKDFWHWVNYDFDLSEIGQENELPAVGVVFHEKDTKNALLLTETLRGLERKEKLRVAKIQPIRTQATHNEPADALPLEELAVLVVWITPALLSEDAADALCQKLAGRKDLVVLPVIAQPCDWKASGWGRYAALPDNIRPLNDPAFTKKESRTLLAALEKALVALPAQDIWWAVRSWEQAEALLSEGHSVLTEKIVAQARRADQNGGRSDLRNALEARLETVTKENSRLARYLANRADGLQLSELKWQSKLPVYWTARLAYLSGELRKVDISSTQVSDLSPLSGLLNLQQLYCSFTQVLDLSPLSGLLNLQQLSCSSTPVSDLSPLAGLLNLRLLWCFTTQVADLSPLSELLNLRDLRCHSTQVSDLSPLGNLLNLQKLTCSYTHVSDLSPLSGLLKLQLLNCHSTYVSDLSPLLPLIAKGIPVNWESPNIEKEIFVQNCPLIIPPVEFAQESPQAVRDYFEELGDDGRKLNEVKVIFLGEASAGKTSLVKRLMGEAFDHKESQTHGIRIRKMPFGMDDGDTVIAHLWDFGGQEVMHATHQFFLSQRSVYVLLLNSRNDDQAEKWLKHAASFGGRSPVLVVLNKIDENPSFEVNRKTLQEKYPQIRAFFRVSAQTKAGMDEFKEALRREIDRADTRRTPFPEHWLAVKEHFADMTADYIESAEYQQVCEAKGVTRQFSQDVLLKFLHDLGVVINFEKLKNFDTQILNPLWLTNGVYRIINSEMVANAGGLLREADFDAVINDPRYQQQGNTTDRVYHFPKGKLLYIVRVMQEFELCFVLPDARTYVVPQLLPVQEPDFKAEGAMVRFVIHFPDFLPDSVFPRLMVKLHTFIAASEAKSEAVTSSHRLTTSMWRTGMVLHKPNIFKALARVRWDKEDQKILVDVCGDDRRKLLSFIRETVREIVGSFTNLKYEELVPVPGCDDTQEYEYLVEAEKAGEKDMFIKALKKRVLIADLLDGVEEPAMRDEVEQLPVRAFVSYAHADLEYLKELKTALAPLMRLQKLQLWDDRDINAGDEWEKVLFQQLEECDIVLCLVSADFVASDFCYKKEFGAALEAHRKGEKTIVPIWLRPCDLDGSPIATFQSTNSEWITSAKNKDEAWTQVSKSLRPALDKAKHRKKALLDQRREF